MAEHEIVKRAFLNKTPAREDFFVFSVSNIVDVLPGQVITEDQVNQLFADGVDVTINLPMPPPNRKDSQGWTHHNSVKFNQREKRSLAPLVVRKRLPLKKLWKKKLLLRLQKSRSDFKITLKKREPEGSLF